jgi:large subunit ribosomal protein L29
MTKPTAELRECETDELEQRLADARQELFNLRFQHVTGQLDNSARLGQVKRQLARIHTLLREREIEAAEALESGEEAAGAGAPATTGAATGAGESDEVSE